MKINEEQALVGMDKALSSSLQNDFEMENIGFGLIEKTKPKPMLLTAVFGNSTDNAYLETNTVKYDELTDTLQLPSGKRFEEYGNDLKKDKALQRIFEVGSFGLRYNVAPKDYANKRKPASTELMDEEYVIAQMMKKSRQSWDLFNEISFATLLTSDQNNIFSGPMPQYNYFTDIVGTARGAKVDMDLGSTAIDHFSAFGDVYDTLQEQLDVSMSSMSSALILCGKDFYNSRFLIEKQEGLAREVRGPLDLASMSVPRDNFGATDGNFAYQYFDSHDGFRYIRYSAAILGTKMIADADAYVVPLGSDVLFKRVFAPAQDRDNVNTTALESYAWTRTSNRTGVHVAQESNVLFMNISPKLIIPLTSTS